MTATYLAAPGFVGSSSSPDEVTVAKAPTRLSRVAGDQRVSYGHEQGTTFTASVGDQIPDGGTITPKFGGQAPGKVTVRSGQASCVAHLHHNHGACTLTNPTKPRANATYRGSRLLHPSSGHAKISGA